MEVTTPITFVSGKGGVGKSAVAAGLALESAKRGHKTLLVEFGETSFYEKFFQVSNLKNPTLLKTNLYGLCLSSEDSLRHYISHFIKVRKMVDLFFNTRPMRALVKAAPALKELALLGQVTSHVRQHGPELEYDRIVIDAYASGHLLALLRAPYGMYEAVKFGPMGEQCLSLQKTLSDPRITSFKLVSLLEEAPVAETIELFETLKSEFKITPEIIANKVYKHSLPNPQSEFAVYLSEQIKKQKASRGDLEKAVKVSHELPFYFELNPWNIVESMALDFGGVS